MLYVGRPAQAMALIETPALSVRAPEPWSPKRGGGEGREAIAPRRRLLTPFGLYTPSPLAACRGRAPPGGRAPRAVAWRGGQVGCSAVQVSPGRRRLAMTGGRGD